MALLLDLCDGPMAMLTLDEDCVSVVLPPSAADSPEITKPLEKLRFPNSRLSVDEDEDTWRKAPQSEKMPFLHTAQVLGRHRKTNMLMHKQLSETAGCI